jgi:hypothetical protein
MIFAGCFDKGCLHIRHLGLWCLQVDFSCLISILILSVYGNWHDDD